jgi:hypothetical protein
MNNIYTIDIFDFDGTLVNSPQNNDDNKLLWEEKTGRKWKRNKKGKYSHGWWGVKESLNPDIFDISFIEETKKQALQSFDDLETLTILMTGRMPFFSDYVFEILRRNNMDRFARYIFNDTSLRTLDYKIQKIEEMIQEFPTVKEINMWDDRENHVNSFRVFGRDNFKGKFNVTHVKFMGV